MMRTDDDGEPYDGGGWILRTHTYCFCSACYRNMVVVRHRNANVDDEATLHDADAGAGH